MTKINRIVKSKKAISIKEKDYLPKPHPMQHRIDEFRSIPSLVTGRK